MTGLRDYYLSTGDGSTKKMARKTLVQLFKGQRQAALKFQIEKRKWKLESKNRATL